MKSLDIVIRDVHNEVSIEGAKRQYLPIEIDWTCPNCKKRLTMKLHEECLSYPTFGDIHHLYFYCMDCDENGVPLNDCEFIVPIKVDITITIGK